MTGAVPRIEMGSELCAGVPGASVQTALLAGGVALWEWCPAQRLLALSSHLETLLGYPPGAFDGAPETFLDRIVPVDRARFDAALAPRDGEHELDAEFRLVDVNGTPRWVVAKGRVVRDGAGVVTRLIGTMQEIAPALVTERRMRRQQHGLLQLLGAEGVMHLPAAEAFRRITEVAGRTLEIERTSIWLFSDDRREFVCRNLYRRSLGQHMAGAVLDPADFPVYIAALEGGRALAAEDARRDPRTSALSQSYLVPLGITSMLEAPVRREGRVIGVVCHEHVGPMRQWLLDERGFAASIADVVAGVLEAVRRRELTERLARSEERYRDFVNLSLEAILRVDIDPPLPPHLPLEDQLEHLKRCGRVAEANVAWARLLGASDPARLQGRSLESVLRPDVADQILRECIQAGFRWSGYETKVTGVDGGELWLLGSVVGVFEGGRLAGLWGTFRDITRRKAAERALERQARHDPLTGLPNRTWLGERLAAELSMQAAAAHPRGFALLIMDLDHFKEINDRLGHFAGDELLKQMAPRLAPVLAEHGAELARLGGDEFAILVGACRDGDQAIRVAEAIGSALRDPFPVGALRLAIDASIGVAVHPAHGANASMLMRSADIAMYEAKRKGTRVALYAATGDHQSPRRLLLANALNEAIRADEIVLDYQPIFTLAERRAVGVEALVRWRHPEYGLITPEEFIPLAEMGDQIRQLTLKVLAEAARQWCVWRDAGLRLTMSINLSPRVMLDHGFADEVAELLSRRGMPGQALRFEITESAVRGDATRTAGTLERLCRLGISFAIDDFGIGFSSLAYLSRLPLTALKIDRALVANLSSDARDLAIVRATVNLAHDLGLAVVAEGVESEEAARLMGTLGCDEAQGNGLAAPASGAAIGALLGRS